MLFPRLRECEECNSIPGLISQIDCKLTDLAKKQYGNIVFILNKQINTDIISDLLHYKRILQYKYCNSLYLRSEEHTSELQSRENLVCRLLLEKKKISYSGTLQKVD